jgi:hypothetical protein
MSEIPNIKYMDLMLFISKNLGIDLNSVCSTITEHKKNMFVTSSNQIKNRQKICDKLDYLKKKCHLQEGTSILI